MKTASPAVVVVGAGLAGLATAWNLSRRGFDVTVVERASEVGGRSRSELSDGFTLEANGACLSTGDRRLLAWVEALGLRDELLPLRPVVTVQQSGASGTPIDPRGLMGVSRIPGVRKRDALRLVRLPRLMSRYGDRLRFDEPEAASDLDDRCIGDFARLYFGRSVLEHWMAPTATSVALGDAEELSRVFLLRRLRSHGNARPGLLRGALGEIAAAAAAGLTVRTSEVRGLAEVGGRLQLELDDAGSAKRLDADAVVLATPAREAARIASPLLTAAERDGLDAVRMRPAISLAVGLRRAFFTHPQHIVLPHGEGSPLESVILEPGLHGGRVPAGRGLAILRATGRFSEAHLDTPEEALSKELLAGFARIRPGVESAVLRSKLFRVADALPRFDVGRYREIARFERVRDQLRAEGNRLYFAGDYLVDPSLEGAVVSAERTAKAVAEDLGSP